MKKFLIMFAIIALLCLSACADSLNPATQLRLPLCLTAKISGGDSAFELQASADDWSLSFETGHPLNGTVITFNGNKGTASVGDFTREVSEENFPAQSAFVKALRALNRSDASPLKTEEGFKYTIDEMTIMVYYDNEAERIIGIGTEESGRYYLFDIIALKPYEEQSNGAGQH